MFVIEEGNLILSKQCINVVLWRMTKTAMTVTMWQVLSHSRIWRITPPPSEKQPAAIHCGKDVLKIYFKELLVGTTLITETLNYHVAIRYWSCCYTSR